MATSLCARRLRPPLSEALGLPKLIRRRKPPGMLDRGPRSLPRVKERGGRGRQVEKSRLLALIIGWRSDGMDYSQGYSFLGMVVEPFATVGNRSYPEFCVVPSDPRYPGYITPIVAPEPSIEQLARACHSMVGRTGTDMVLWALPHDSAMRLGLTPPRSRLGIQWGCPSCRP
jgi:hypothetical protein